MNDPYSDHDPRDEDYVHISELEKYYDTAQWLQKVLTCVYEDADLTGLEDSLGELCAIYGLRLPDNNPVLVRRSIYGQELYNTALDLIKMKEGSNDTM